MISRLVQARSVPTVSLVAALVFSVAGCGDPGGREAGDEKVYRHSMDGAATSLDPVQASTAYADFLVTNVYDTLYRYKYLERPYALTPNLADEMPEVSDDGLTWTISLREGVRFVDDPAFDDDRGREVTAEDVVFSLLRHFDPEQLSQGSWLWKDRIEGLDEWAREAESARDAGEEPDYGARVEGLRALDDHTLQIRLTRPYPQLPYTLARGFSGVVPPEALDHHGRSGLQRHAVGSGPFRLVSFTTQRAVMEANEEFRHDPVDLAYEGYDESLHGDLGLEAIDGRSPPFIDRLEVDQVSESSARWNSFTAGNEIQYTALPIEQAERLVTSTDPVELAEDYDQTYHWRAYPEAGFVYTNFNLDNPEIGYHEDPERDAANHALRCAIRKAFDWQARNERFYFDLGQVYPGVIPPSMEDFNPDLDTTSVERDLEGARALLEEHGWDAESLPVFEYSTVTGVTDRQMFEQFRDWMVELGFPREKVRMQTYPNFGDFNRAIRQGRAMAFMVGWTMDFPDAENTLQLYYGPNAAPGSNTANMANDEYDRLYEESGVLEAGDERSEIYNRMNEILIDECANIASLSRTRIDLWHPEVIMQPDREILGGFFARFVDVRDPEAAGD